MIPITLNSQNFGQGIIISTCKMNDDKPITQIRTVRFTIPMNANEDDTMDMEDFNPDDLDDSILDDLDLDDSILDELDDGELTESINSDELANLHTQYEDERDICS